MKLKRYETPMLSKEHFLLECGFGRVNLIKNAIKGGFDINSEGKERMNGLLIAARAGDESMVVTLIDLGINVNATDQHCRNALHYAVLYNHQHLIPTLLKAGANPYAIFFTAIMERKIEAIRVLVQCGVDINYKVGGQNVVNLIPEFYDMYYSKYGLFRFFSKYNVFDVLVELEGLDIDETMRNEIRRYECQHVYEEVFGYPVSQDLSQERFSIIEFLIHAGCKLPTSHHNTIIYDSFIRKFDIRRALVKNAKRRGWTERALLAIGFDEICDLDEFLSFLFRDTKTLKE
jgi:hypothetical protein